MESDNRTPEHQHEQPTPPPKLGELSLVHSVEVVEESPCPRIYVACLASYNDGRLHGRWLDATQDPEDLWTGVREMLAASPVPDAEEFAIHDYECFASIRLSEWEPIERVSLLANAIALHGEPFAAWYASCEPDPDADLLEAFDELHIGEFNDEGELADHLMEEFGIEYEVERLRQQLPDSWRTYVNFDGSAFIRDLGYNGELYTARLSDGALTAFWQR